MINHHPNYSLIGQRVKERRKAKQMTQEKLAEHIEMSAKYISHIETGRKKASLMSLYRIVQALDMTLDFLVFGV